MSESKPAGIRDIAKKLGIPIGTVDRALHGRVGISDATRGRVLETARELKYQPNGAAITLKLARSVRVGVFLPAEIAVGSISLIRLATTTRCT